MIRFEKTDNTITFVTDDKNAELALLDDAGFGDLVAAFDDAEMTDGELRVDLPDDDDTLEEIIEMIGDFDPLAAEQLQTLI